jgi:hypothetical protein
VRISCRTKGSNNVSDMQEDALIDAFTEYVESLPSAATKQKRHEIYPGFAAAWESALLSVDHCPVCDLSRRRVPGGWTHTKSNFTQCNKALAFALSILENRPNTVTTA